LRVKRGWCCWPSAPSSAPKRRCSRPGGHPRPVGGGLVQAHRCQVLLPPRLGRAFPDLPGPELHLHHAPGLERPRRAPDNLDLHGYDNNAGVSYLFFGVPPQYDNPPLALAHIFQVEGITVTSVLSITGCPTSSSRRAVCRPAVRGVPRPSTGQGGARAGIHTHRQRGRRHLRVERIGLATTTLWNSVNGGLIEMMGAVQHSFVQDLADIQRLNQQWQAESAQRPTSTTSSTASNWSKIRLLVSCTRPPTPPMTRMAPTARATTGRAAMCSIPSRTSPRARPLPEEVRPAPALGGDSQACFWWLLRAWSAQITITRPMTITTVPRAVYWPCPVIPDPCSAPVPCATHTPPTTQSTVPMIPRTHMSGSDLLRPQGNAPVELR